MNNTLINKTAVITGASGLLGEQHCIALLEIGCDLIVTDINIEQLTNLAHKLQVTYPSNKIYKFQMDVSDEKSIKSVVQSVRDEGIEVNILINNAAINPNISKTELENTARLEFFDLNDWNRQISVGLTGAFLCCKHFGFMLSQNLDGGVILNIASDLSVIAPDQRLYSQPDLLQRDQTVKPVTYYVIKTGLLGLTRYLSTYWAEKNVRCNALSPGGIQTKDQNPEFVSRIEKLIPMGRMATKKDYHGVVQFLCSNASAYLNGQNIVVDGGRSVW